jgi:hypothetical protein
VNQWKKRYHPNDGEQVEIEGVPVQFLVPPNALVEEALDQAVGQKAFGVATRVFSYEHLLSIMLQTGRGKDFGRISQCLESKPPDEKVLTDILSRHQLLDKWSKLSL